MTDKPAPLGATHRHIKRGTFYTEVGRGWLEATMENVVIYRALSDCTLWVRPAKEFDDPGRFERLP